MSSKSTLEDYLYRTFVNVHDGRRATLAYKLVSNQPSGEVTKAFHMEYWDRGEQREDPITLTKLRQDWRDEDYRPRALLEKEISLVARCADNALRAIEKNEPFRFWRIEKEDVAYDAALLELIGDYLRERR